MEQLSTDARRRNSGARIFVIVFVLGLAAFFYYRYWRAHVSHIFHHEGAPFAERLAEPASFIYGSSIHIWNYQNAGETVEIAVTGHADESTCREMTGLVNNAYLQKYDDPGDLFVAGAARLSAGQAALSLDDQQLAEYLTVLRALHEAEGGLQNAKRNPIEGGDKETAIQEMTDRTQRLRAYLKQLDAKFHNPGIEGAAQSLTALGIFVREAVHVADGSGLVQIHTLPFGLAEETRERIQKSIESKITTVVRFDDLLAKWRATEASLLVDVLRTDTARPLELRIPLNDLSTDGFEEARRANRSEVESSMVGDAERRRRFYQEEENEYQDDLRRCRDLSSSQREEVVVLNQRVSPDGFKYQVQDGIRITRGEYCDQQIPGNLRIVGTWLVDVDDLLKSIHDDTTKVADSHIEAIDHATLVDSMLRDWKLPVDRAQEAFDYWRQRRRGPVWHQLDAALDRAKVDRTAINGEHVIFSVRVSGQELVVRPVHVLDLARAVLVIDPRAGVTRIADAWEGRTPVPASDTAQYLDQAKKLAGEAVAAASSGDWQHGRDLLKRGLSADPTTAAETLERAWLQLFRDDSAQRAELEAKVKNLSARQERLAAITELFNSPDLKQDDDREFLRRLHLALEADSGLPVDYHLLFALQAAGDLAAISQVLVERGARGKPLKTWDVIHKAMNGGLKRTAADDPFAERMQALYQQYPNLYAQLASSNLGTEAARAFEKYYDFDPEKAIKTAMAIVAKRAPDYFESAQKTEGMPQKESAEKKDMFEGGEVPIFEWDATEMDGVRDQMTRRSHAETASYMLWTPGQVSAALVRQELANATQKEYGITIPAFQSASERLGGFVNGGKELDMLARLEIGQIIASGSKELLLRSKMRLETPKTVRSAVLSTGPRLQARVLFEDHRYASAYDVLYSSSIAVALYSPQLKWSANEKARDIVTTVWAVCDQGGVSVRGGQVPILSLSGMSAPDACALAAAINGKRLVENAGRPFEQVLAMQIPLRSEALSLRKLLADSSTRLAVIKAMVFGDVFPAEDLVPPARVPAEKDKPAAVDFYRVPTLDETAQAAAKRYVGAKN